MTDAVDTKGQARIDMERLYSWRLLEALRGGTQAMRDEEWLPRQPRELGNAYNYRVLNSYLWPGFTGAIDALAALPFQKPLTLDNADGIDPRLAKLFEDADREGTSLHDFAHQCDEDGDQYGMTHILVDYPSPVANPTRRDDQELDIRPYFCRISPRNLLRWKWKRDATGKRQLDYVAIYEKTTEAKGQYEDETVEYVREITTTEFRVWRKAASDSDWAEGESGTHTFGMVPMVTVYYDQTGPMTAKPPLLDLAWLNLKHFRSESEQSAALSFARFPILFGRGFSEDEARSFSAVGAGQAFFSRAPDAQLSSVEHSGMALDAGRLAGEDMIAQMVALGAQPLIEQTSTTATGEQRQDRRATSKRQEWVNALSAGLKRAYKIAADVLKVELPAKFGVNINGDFVLAAQEALHVQALQGLRGTGDISQPTIIAEFKRRGILAATVDAETERELVGGEGPALSSFPPEPPDPDNANGGPGTPLDKPVERDGMKAA